MDDSQLPTDSPMPKIFEQQTTTKYMRLVKDRMQNAVDF